MYIHLKGMSWVSEFYATAIVEPSKGITIPRER